MAFEFLAGLEQDAPRQELPHGGPIPQGEPPKKIRKAPKITPEIAESTLAELRGRLRGLVPSDPAQPHREYIDRVRNYFITNYGGRPEEREKHPLYQDFLKMVEAQDVMDEAARTGPPGRQEKFTPEDEKRIKEELERIGVAEQETYKKGLPLDPSMVHKRIVLEKERERVIDARNREWFDRSRASASDGFLSAFAGARLKKSDVADAVIDVTKKYGLDPLVKASFPAGVKQLLQDEFPELIPAFVSEYKRIFGERTEEGGIPKLGGGEKAGGDGVSGEVHDPFGDERLRWRALIQEFANSGDLQNWYSIVLFVLLSAVAGPKSAMLLFSNAHKRDTLRLQMDELRSEIDAKAAFLREKQRREQEERAFAARYLLRREEKEDDRAFQLKKMVLAHELTLSRARSRGGAEDKVLVDAMEKDFQRDMAMAGRQLQIMQDPYMPQPSKDAAGKAYNEYMGRAAKVDALLRVRFGEAKK